MHHFLVREYVWAPCLHDFPTELTEVVTGEIVACTEIDETRDVACEDRLETCGPAAKDGEEGEEFGERCETLSARSVSATRETEMAYSKKAVTRSKDERGAENRRVGVSVKDSLFA